MGTKVKIDPAALYQPVMSFAGELNGVPIILNPSANLRGDHPAIKKWPSHFILADSSTQEKRAAYAELAGPPVVPDDVPVGIVLEQLSGPDVVQSTEDWQFGHELVMKGQRLRDSHPLVKQYPECFKAIES